MDKKLSKEGEQDKKKLRKEGEQDKKKMSKEGEQDKKKMSKEGEQDKKKLKEGEQDKKKLGKGKEAEDLLNQLKFHKGKEWEEVTDILGMKKHSEEEAKDTGDKKKNSKASRASGTDDDDNMQKVFERRVTGSRRSRRRSRQEARLSSGSPPRERDGSGGSGSNIPQEPQATPGRGSGGGGIQVFPPRPPPQPRLSKERRGSPEKIREASAEVERRRLSSGFELRRVPSPDIVVTLAKDQQTQPPLSALSKRVSPEFLKPPGKRRKRHRHRRKGSKGSSEGDSKSLRSKPSLLVHGPRRMQRSLAAALRGEQREGHGEIGQPVQIRLTKSHTLVRAKQRHRKDHPEQWTKEEVDWEWKELLWRMNVVGRIYNGVADVEYRIVRMSYKYHDLLLPYMVIALMFFLPFAMLWDYMALNYYEVPQFTFMIHTGCIALIHFIAVMMNAYTYMIASLQNTRPRIRFILGIGMFVHPILFFLRCWFDKVHEMYTAEYTVFYDAYEMSPEKARHDVPEDGRDAYVHEFQPWDQFVADREYYFNLHQ